MRRGGHVSIDLGSRVRDRIDRVALSDRVLIARVRGGDAEALDVLVQRHRGTVETVARARLRDPEDACDAAQEALARIVVGVGTYRGEAAFATWVHRVATNACEDHARRVARRARAEVPADLDVESFSDGGACAAAMLERDDGRDLRAVLAALSERQRGVVVLKDVLALRYEDVAAALALPIGTVKCHAHRGRKVLARHLRRSA